MATCKVCVFYEHCSGYLPTDMDKDVFDMCAKGRTDEITDIDERCSDFKLNHYAQIAAAWDEFKDEFTNLPLVKFVIRFGDKLAVWLERFGK